MSVQLIVYPQSYNGTYNAISTSSTEFLVNGINFNGLNSTATFQSNGNYPPYQDVLDNEPASIPNTWYRFRVDGVVAYPIVSGGNLILDSIAGPATQTGVYQRLTNLTIGATYNITINSTAPPSTGFISFIIADGNNIVSTGGSLATNTLIALGFVATSTDPTIMFAFSSNVVGTMNITSISIQPLVGSVSSGATNVLDNGQVILDLYEDEDLPLTLSVDNFKNVAEKVQSYSKAFKLPATKRNNRIFDQMFEITRTYDGVIFNPYRRTQCVLKQDGFILFNGFLRLLEVTEKEDEISYNVNLYAEVVALADTLKDRTFSDFDFGELQHPYNKTQIKYSWNDGGTGITYTNPNTSGFRNDFSTVKYPFVDWTHQYTLDANGNTVLPNLESSFRPFINIKYLIDRIFQAAPFTYESEFFDTDDFKKLYMDFNWGQGSELIYGVGRFFPTGVSGTDPPNVSTTSFTNLRLYEHTSNSPLSAIGYDVTTGILTSTVDDSVFYVSYYFWLDRDIAGTADFRWIHKDSSGNTIDTYNVTSLSYTSSSSSALVWDGNFTILLDINETLEPQFKTNIAAGVQQKDFFSNTIFGLNPSLITTNTLLQTLRGELKQWDFLKGLMTMFNLVSIPDEDNPNNIIFEPYSDVFIPTATAGNTLANRGIEHDWTDKIDVSEMKLNPLADLNKKTIFKFVEDDDDYSFNQYNNLVGNHLYGSQKYDATEFTILDGEDEIEVEPFAATLVKPLMPEFPSFITPALYAMNDDGTTEGFDNIPRIMYNNGIKSTGTSYEIPAQNGVVGSAAETDFLQFSHLSAVPTITGSRDFHFGICQLMPGVGAPVPDNLFNLYWLPYYSELYNPNTRIMVIKVNLSPADINTFKFNDTVYIKNRVFRVNKIDYKPNDLATVEFILLP